MNSRFNIHNFVVFSYIGRINAHNQSTPYKFTMLYSFIAPLIHRTFQSLAI